MTHAISKTEFHVDSNMIRTLCLFICCAMVLTFALVCNTEVAYCTSTGTDVGLALEEAITNIANEIYKAMRGIITPFVVIAFAAAGFQFLLGGNQGTEKAKKYIFGGAIGLVFVVFAPVFAQQLALWFASYGASDLSSYNPL